MSEHKLDVNFVSTCPQCYGPTFMNIGEYRERAAEWMFKNVPDLDLSAQLEAARQTDESFLIVRCGTCREPYKNCQCPHDPSKCLMCVKQAKAERRGYSLAIVMPTTWDALQSVHVRDYAPGYLGRGRWTARKEDAQRTISAG